MRGVRPCVAVVVVGGGGHSRIQKILKEIKKKNNVQKWKLKSKKSVKRHLRKQQFSNFIYYVINNFTKSLKTLLL